MPSTLVPVAVETSFRICSRLEFEALMRRPWLSQVTVASSAFSLAGHLGISRAGGVMGGGVAGAAAPAGWASLERLWG